MDDKIEAKLKTINTSSSMKKGRLEFIDIARGIGIILMIIGHTIDIGLNRNFIFSFHVPMFIICSGYFFNKEESIINTIKKIFIKLFLPYIITSLAVTLISCIKGDYKLSVGIIGWLKQILVSCTLSGKYDFSSINGLGVLYV